MDSEISKNKNGLDLIIDLIDSPLIVVDKNGTVLILNKYLKNISENKNIANIYDTIDPSTAAIMDDFLKSLNDKEIIIHNSLFCINNVEERYKLIIKKDPDLNIFYCLFTPEGNRLNVNENINILIKENNISEIIIDEKIKEIIKDVKENYPFSFIGSERIKKVINSVQDMFWLKDASGKYILVNNNFADGFGLKASQFEGKNEKDYIPAFLVNFYTTIEDYILQTANNVVIEGIPVKGIKTADKLYSIEIPLMDANGKILCIIGVTQSAINKNNENNYPIAIDDFNNLDSIFFLTSEDGKIIFANNNFYHFFNQPKHINNDIHLQDFLTKENLNYIHSFVQEEKNINLNIWEKEKSFLCKKLIKNNKVTGIKIEEDNRIEIDSSLSGRNSMFDLLIQNNPEPVFIYEKDNLKFLEVNKAAMEMYGYRKEEFLEMDLTDLYSPEDIQSLLNDNHLKQGEFTGPYRHKRKDGSSIYIEISKIKINYQEKECHFNIVRNVSAKLEEEKKLKIYKAAFDNSDFLMLITDATGFINFANTTANEIFAQNNEKLTGNSFVSLVEDNKRKNVISEIFHNSSYEERELLVNLKTNKNEWYEILLKVIPITDFKNEIDAFILLAKNKQEPIVETVIKEVVKEVIKEVPVMKTETRTLSQNNDFTAPEFLSHLFHDLLTPINAIFGFSQELSESIENKTADQKEAVEIISQSRNTLLETMNSVIEYASFTAMNEGKEENISMPDVINEIQNADEGKRGKSEIKFIKVSSSLKFTTYKEKFIKFITLLMKVTSLLNNNKEIYFSTNQMDDENFIIIIKTNKTNISADLLNNYKNIFLLNKTTLNPQVPKFAVQLLAKLFEQLKGKFNVPESNANYAGFEFPIELKNIAREKIEQKVIAEIKTLEPEKQKEVALVEDESFEPVASIYKLKTDEAKIEEVLVEEEIKIPVTVSAKRTKKEIKEEEIKEVQVLTEEQKPKQNKINLSKIACLYIEDHLDAQTLFKVQMKELKDIQFAVSFEESIPLLENNNFDIIILDINLQGEYNGLDALKLIRKMPKFKDTPVLAATAYVLPGDHEKFIASGFNEFLAKPLIKEQVMEVLEKVL